MNSVKVLKGKGKKVHLTLSKWWILQNGAEEMMTDESSIYFCTEWFSFYSACPEMEQNIVISMPVCLSAVVRWQCCDFVVYVWFSGWCLVCLAAGYQPRPQLVDRGTTARYGGQLRYINKQSWTMQLGGRKGIRPVKTWGGYGCYRSSASYRTRKVPIQDNNNHHLTVREQRDEWPETAIQNLPNPMRTNGEPDLVIQCFLMPTPLNCSDWA